MQMIARIFIMIFSFYGIIFSQIIPIKDLHKNNSQGVPLAPYSVGATVTISGIVTVPSGLLSKTNFEIYVQDATGGINVFASGMVATVALGDSVTITGKIDHFRGLTEIKGDAANPLTIINHGAGFSLPEPLFLTCQQLANSYQSDNSEPNESQLVKVRNVSYRRTEASSGGIMGELTDNSGTCLIFLDIDTNIPEPVGRVNVIGILKQYDTTSPYKSGYEIIPRYNSDISPVSGPKILTLPVESEITATAVNFFWRTQTSAKGRIEYGLSQSYELGSVSAAGIGTDHYVTLSGLTPATIYHYRAIAEDETGQSKTNDLLFSTASSENFPARIKVFFNQTVDNNLAWQESANGLSNFEIKLIDQISRAKYSIDFCMHNLTLESVRDVLIQTYKRGVKVRYIYENENPANVSALTAAGIPCLNDASGANDGQGYMHNKFVIFDARDADPTTEDVVWTGSFNATISGKDYNAENVLIIQDQAVAKAFTAEFNEMWGSDSDSPDPNQARFGSRKSDNVPHRFQVAGIPVQVYFSPGDQVASKILDVIDSADQNLYFCIYGFTRDDIAIKMRAMWNQGVQVKGVFDNEQISNYGSEYDNLNGTGPYAWSPPADVVLDREISLLHHKYLIVDPCDPSSDPVLVTGSYNWSINAETVNDENIVIVHDPNLVNQYLQEFSARYRKAGGSETLCIPTQVAEGEFENNPDDYRLDIQAFPNPFNDQLNLVITGLERFPATELRIYNVRGELVKRFQISTPSALHSLAWDATDYYGHKVGSGIYFAVCGSGNQMAQAKFLYLR